MKGDTANPSKGGNVLAMKPSCSRLPGRRKHVCRLAIVFLLVGCVCVPAPAADDEAAGARASLERIQALRKERPGDGALVFYEAVVRLSLAEREAAFELLRSLKGRKLGLIPARVIGFDAVWDDPEFPPFARSSKTRNRKRPPRRSPSGLQIRSSFRRASPLTRRASAFSSAALPDARSSSRMRKGRRATSPGLGQARRCSRTHDRLRRALYAVSTNGFEESAKTERRNAVVRYDLKKGRLLDRFAAPEAVQLNDLAVAPDGTLYVTDSMSGTLFRKKPAEETLTRFGETGALRGANGIAIAPDGKLYVTLSTGIARVDTATGEPTRLPQPDTVVTGGIDGLYWHDGDLFGVQNSTNPGRVIRIATRGQRHADRGSNGVAVASSS